MKKIVVIYVDIGETTGKKVNEILNSVEKRYMDKFKTNVICIPQGYGIEVLDLDT